jgi:hypothetical protein
LVSLPAKTQAGENDLYATLRYEIEAAPRGCWDETKFRRGVAHRIGYDPFREDAPLTVQIHVGGNALSVDGRVEWRTASGEGMGERKFVAKDGNCSRLMTEMSFAVGLQIEFLRLKPPKPPASPAGATTKSDAPSIPVPSRDEAAPATPIVSEAPQPAVVAEEAPPSTTKANEAQPEPEKIDRAAPPAPPQEDESSPAQPSPPWTMWAGAGGALAWRLAPGTTADGRLFLGLRRLNLSFEFAAEATYPSTFRRWDGSGFRHTLVGGTLAICGHMGWFSACALGRASQVRIEGLGVDQPRTPNGFVGQAGGRMAATFLLAGAWSVAAHVDGLALFTHSTVRLNQAAVWDMPRLGAVVGADVLVRFR